MAQGTPTPPEENPAGDAVIEVLKTAADRSAAPAALPPTTTFTTGQRVAASILAALDPEGYKNIVLPALEDARRKDAQAIAVSEQEKSREQAAFNALLSIAQRTDELNERKARNKQLDEASKAAQEDRDLARQQRQDVLDEKTRLDKQLGVSRREEVASLPTRLAALKKRASDFNQLASRYGDQPAISSMGPDALAAVEAHQQTVTDLQARASRGEDIDPTQLTRLNADLDDLGKQITAQRAMLTQFTTAKPKAGGAGAGPKTRMNVTFLGQFTEAIGDATDAAFMLREFNAAGRPGGYVTSQLAAHPNVLGALPQILSGVSSEQLSVIQRYANFVQAMRTEALGAAQSVTEMYNAALNLPAAGTNGEVIAGAMRTWVRQAYYVGLEKRRAMELANIDVTEMGKDLGHLFAAMAPDLQLEVLQERGLPDMPFGTVILGTAIDSIGQPFGWKVQLPDGETAIKPFYGRPAYSGGAQIGPR